MPPIFSILIPTRDRPITFRHTLDTVVHQSGYDFEIVVADNDSGPAIKNIIDEYSRIGPPIKHIRSDQILQMSDNWENGLNHCTGEYVTILGDDDALVPSTLAAIRNIVIQTSADLINWKMHTYWWPDTVAFWNANRLYVTFSTNEANWITSSDLLKDFYDSKVSFDSLPMIYNSFVHRRLIEKVKKQYGLYFYAPKVVAPDITSGIVNTLHTDKFIQVARPLSVRGNSQKSGGTAYWTRKYGKKQREAIDAEMDVTYEELCHPTLIPTSCNMAIAIASIKLFCKDAYFPDDDNYKIDPLRILNDMVAGLNFEPEAYDENLLDIEKYAEKIAVPMESFKIPEKQMRDRTPYQGFIHSQDGNIGGVCVNCDLAGVFNVAEAAKLADAMSLNI